MADDSSTRAMEGPDAERRQLLGRLIVDLVRVRAQVAEGGSWTTCDICRDVGEVMRADCSDVKEALAQLKALGQIRNLPSDEWAEIQVMNTWAAAPSSAARLAGGDGGGGLIRNEDGRPSSPQRYPEVLAHPVLFALSPEEFESTLAQMLPE